MKILIVVISALGTLFLAEVGMRLTGERILAVQEEANEIRPEDASKIRIVTLGESTTADPLSLKKSNAWPRQLERLLLKQGVNARVYNLGKTAIPSSEILRDISKQLDRYRPDIVISMMGINDENVIVWDEPSWWERLRIANLFRWAFSGSSEHADMMVYWRSAYLAERQSGLAGERQWVDILTKLKGKELAQNFLETKERTTKNYQKLHRLLTERNIRHIAMQYPTRPIEWLKKSLSGPEFRDIIFIENKANFAKVLRDHPYEYLFDDTFAGDFGHTNGKGHILIAKSALEGVLEAIQGLKARRSNFPEAVLGSDF